MLGSAIAVVALITIGGVAFTASQAPAVATVAMVPVQHENVVTASMVVTPKGWGTRFDWSCSYLTSSGSYSDPVSYDLVVVKKSGAQSVVATWSSVGPHAAGLAASSDVAFGDIRSIEIRLAGSSTALLRENL
jgi:hypothetical protein